MVWELHISLHTKPYNFTTMFSQCSDYITKVNRLIKLGIPVLLVDKKRKLIQYRPRALQHLHVHKLRGIWRISTKNPRKKLACKFLHELLHTDFLHANLSILLRWLILLTKIHASCVYFFYNRQCGWCKIRNRHCGKTSSWWKRKQLAIHFLLLWSCYDRERHVL